MSTKMLFYKNLAPLNKVHHANWVMTGSNSFDFAKTSNSVPIAAVEFPAAAKDLTIVFAKNQETIVPITILGVRQKENVFVDAEGKWQANYIPAFIRRYPFVFSTEDEGKTLTLCVDESCDFIAKEGEGEKLFNEDGANSKYLDNVIGFLKDFQNHTRRSELFCEKLKSLDILEPMAAKFKTPDGQEGSLNGFFVVSREKLKELSQEKITDLVKTDELELIYHHLSSLNNLNDVIKKTTAPAKEQETETSDS